MRINLVLIVFLIFGSLSHGQIVTTEPTFPSAEDQITITYDATQGTGSLAGLPLGQKVYAHVGLITEANGPGSWQYVTGNWGTADSRTEMTRIGTSDLWQLTFSPSLIGWAEENNNANATIATNIQVNEIALVFRNASGSLEGKTDDGSDIFVPVFSSQQGLISGFATPTEYSTILEQGEDLNVLINASLEATISLYDNGSLVAEEQNVNNLDFTINGLAAGDHELVMVATDGIDEVRDTVYYVINGNVVTQPYPNGTEPGINRIEDDHIRFALTAPGKDYVYLIGDFNNWIASADYFMKVSPDGVWWVDVEGLDPNTEYAYQYYVDGQLKIADPYSEIILDPYNDQYISEETFPNLKEYPHGKTTGNATSFFPVKPIFDWQYDNYDRPSREELVVYELLIRDFVEDRNFVELMTKLDYLENLGINAIELMPISEFEGNLSWGYNTSFHHALDKYYGSPEIFKTFVDACHERGIAVLLDIALNHGFSQCPLAQLYWDNDAGDWGKPAADNPWFNVDPTHNFNVGSDFNHESPRTQYYVDRVVKHWIEEYHIDGYRFDLTKGFTQNVGGPFDAGAYDQSRIDLLKRMANVIWDLDSESLLILEHFADNSEEKNLANFGFMLWGNMNYQYNEATMGYNNDLNWGVYKERGWNDPHLVSYMESHDEERLMFKNLEYGNSGPGYSVKDFNTALARQELATTFFLTVPGPKMIWQFGELGFEYSIFTCSDGTVNLNDTGCKLDPKPVVWQFLDNQYRVKLHDVNKAILDLRKSYDVFHTADFDYDLYNSNQKRIRLFDDEMNVVIIGSFDMDGESVSANFPSTGTWYEYFSGETVDVSDVNMSFDLQAGEYRLYTNVDIGQADVNNLDQILNRQLTELTLFPNPTNGILEFKEEIDLAEVLRIRVLFTNGMTQIVDAASMENGTLDLNNYGLGSGQYMLEILTEDAVYFGRFVMSK